MIKIYFDSEWIDNDVVAVGLVKKDGEKIEQKSAHYIKDIDLNDQNQRFQYNYISYRNINSHDILSNEEELLNWLENQIPNCEFELIIYGDHELKLLKKKINIKSILMDKFKNCKYIDLNKMITEEMSEDKNTISTKLDFVYDAVSKTTNKQLQNEKQNKSLIDSLMAYYIHEFINSHGTKDLIYLLEHNSNRPILYWNYLVSEYFPQELSENKKDIEIMVDREKDKKLFKIHKTINNEIKLFIYDESEMSTKTINELLEINDELSSIVFVTKSSKSTIDTFLKKTKSNFMWVLHQK